jgi:DNA repair exonuclease SbcCD nuclease subunit
VRIVHAADLHIDSPLVGLERYDGAPVQSIRSATRRAFVNLIDLCLREEAALLLLAGDLFDDDWRDYSTGLFFVSELQRLAARGTRVVMVRGNHDAASHVTRHLSLPGHVTELSSKHAETVRLDDIGVAVHGKSYAERAESTNLSLLYPDPVPGYFNIGLLHTSVSGRPGHEPYAPCNVSDLVARGYDYWALGHVHQREVLCENPWIVFPGNLQGRHLRETGPKGATLVHVEGGFVERVEARDLSVVRFADVEVPAALDDDPETVIEAVARAVARAVDEAEGRALVLRAVVSGVTRAHAAFQLDRERWDSEIRARAAEHSDVWLAQVAFRTAPPIDLSAVRGRKDAVGELLLAVDQACNDPARLAEFAELFSDLRARLPADVRQGSEGVRLEDPELMREVLSEVEQLLLVHLVDADR